MSQGRSKLAPMRPAVAIMELEKLKKEAIEAD